MESSWTPIKARRPRNRQLCKHRCRLLLLPAVVAAFAGTTWTGATWRAFVLAGIGETPKKPTGVDVLADHPGSIIRGRCFLAPAMEKDAGAHPERLAALVAASATILCTCYVSRAASRQRYFGRLSFSHQRAYTSVAQTYEGAAISAPPDLPSLLLKNRIVYLGMPITNQVAELIIAQLLYLSFDSAEKPVTMYINSTGSTIKAYAKHGGESKVGLETDAFAVADCMQYIKPQVHTIAVGQAYGTAAMLLGMGTKGKRFALPNTTIMLSEPCEPPTTGPRQAADIRISACEVLHNRTTMAELLAGASGKTVEKVIEDTQRCKYMSPREAVEYHLIDKVLSADKIQEYSKPPALAAT